MWSGLGVLGIVLAAAQPASGDIALRGDRIEVKFAADDFHVTSLRASELLGETVSAKPTPGHALWRMELRSKRGLGDSLLVNALAACRRSHEISQDAGGATLRLFWKAIDIGQEKAVMDVTATVSLPRDSDLVSWKLDITNRSTVYGVWEYFFPAIEIGPPDPDLEKNFYLNTFRTGELVPDPFHVRPNARGKRLYDYVRDMNTTGTTKAGQFMALYGANGRGFYYASQDGEGWQKRFVVSFFPKLLAVRLEMMHLPWNLGYAGEDCHMAYPVVCGPFRGDWYDACQIYRQWAVKQVWCRKGPVAQRKDIPEWLKDCALVVRQDTKADSWKGPSITPQNVVSLAQNRDNYLRCLDLFGPNVASIWYTWWIKDPGRSATSPTFLRNQCNGNDGQLHAPLPGVLEANRRAIAAGGYPLAYINGVLHDQGDAAEREEAQQAVQRDEKGNPYTQPSEKGLCRMCGFAPWWQQRYAELCRRAVKEAGFKGVYWDSYGKDSYRCFVTSHGHGYGGGTKVVQGERALGEIVRRAIKEADPEAVTSAEASSEEFIDLVDTNLYAVVLRENVAPVSSCVYHDYQMFYGRTLVANMPEPEFSMEAAYNFSTGGELGRYFISGKSLDCDNPANAEKAAFLKALVAMKQAAKGFLNLGRMLRPPAILGPMPMLTARVRYENQTVTLPAVLSSAWRSPEGEVGLVFVNVAMKPVEVRYRIDTVEYGFPAGAPVVRYQLSPEGRRPIEQIVSGPQEEKMTLTGHEIKVLVLKNP